MGIYIKGMKMPKDCDCCDFCEYEQGQCLTSDYRNTYPRVKGKRPEWCPLIEVKTPHGRLVDANAEYKALSEMKVEGEVFVTAVEFAKIEMEQVPTVIEAEVE